MSQHTLLSQRIGAQHTSIHSDTEKVYSNRGGDKVTLSPPSSRLGSGRFLPPFLTKSRMVSAAADCAAKRPFTPAETTDINRVFDGHLAAAASVAFTAASRSTLGDRRSSDFERGESLQRNASIFPPSPPSPCVLFHNHGRVHTCTCTSSRCTASTRNIPRRTVQYSTVHKSSQL